MLAGLCKTTEQIYMILGEWMSYLSGDNPLSFGADPDHWADTGFSLQFLQHCEMGLFFKDFVDFCQNNLLI